jgi:hypothetical protein
MASTSGSIEKIEFGPSKAPWEATKTEKIPLMQYIKITWKTCRETKMIPYILSEGQSRDVLCGTDVATKEEASVVVKTQALKWHDDSNGHEFGLAENVGNHFSLPASFPRNFDILHQRYFLRFCRLPRCF